MIDCVSDNFNYSTILYPLLTKAYVKNTSLIMRSIKLPHLPLTALFGDEGPLFITIAFVLALGDFGTIGEAPFFFLIVYDPR